MKILIYGFKDNRHLEKVLYEIEEKTSAKWYGGTRPCNHPIELNPHTYIRIVDDVLFHGSFRGDYKDHKQITADDYLNPIKIGDMVEVVDDTDMNGFKYRVRSDIGNGMFLLEDKHSQINRHQDYLALLRKIEKGDIVRYVGYEKQYIVNEVYNKLDKYQCNFSPIHTDRSYDVSWSCNLELVPKHIGTPGGLDDEDYNVLEPKEMIRQHLKVGDVIEYPDRYKNEYKYWLISSINDGGVTVQSSGSQIAYGIGLDYTMDKMQPYRLVTDQDKINDFKSRLTNDGFHRDMLSKIDGKLGSGYNVWKNNLNNKTNTMGYEINKDAMNVANEEYFENKTNVAAIRKADTYLATTVDLLDTAIDDIKNKFITLDKLKEEINQTYATKNSREMKEILANIKEIQKYIDKFLESTVKDLGDVKSKANKFDVNKFFE